jgi:hypothetical protein
MAVLCAGLALSSIHPSSEQVNREGQSLSLKKFGVTAEKCLAEYGLDRSILSFCQLLVVSHFQNTYLGKFLSLTFFTLHMKSSLTFLLSIVI